MINKSEKLVYYGDRMFLLCSIPAILLFIVGTILIFSGKATFSELITGTLTPVGIYFGKRSIERVREPELIKAKLEADKKGNDDVS